MGLELITAPEEYPVTLEEAKLHCAVDTDITELDTHFSDIWIPAATQQAEQRTGRKLITQTWKVTREAFPASAISLPYPKLQAVNSIKYLDPDGVLQTMDPADYQVVTDELIGFVMPAYGKSWPGTRCYPGAVRIEFVSGFGAATAVPQSIKNWMLMALGTWYSNREGVVTGTIVSDLPRDFFAALLDPYVIPRM